jgi:hypothetical protein
MPWTLQNSIVQAPTERATLRWQPRPADTAKTHRSATVRADIPHCIDLTLRGSNDSYLDPSHIDQLGLAFRKVVETSDFDLVSRCGHFISGKNSAALRAITLFFWSSVNPARTLFGESPSQCG